MQDMLRTHLRFGGVPETFHLRWAAQLNDTHPAVAVPELMRLLLDEHGLDWDTAWDVTQKTIAYTNHTLLPEALETWSVELFGSLLPRHLEIVFEINRRLLDRVRNSYPGNDDRVSRMSLIDERGSRYVRMANLACAGSHAINGVAALHTDLLKRHLLPDWVDMFPERFCNVTNGVTPRRFMVLSNPGLTELISEKIGHDWPIQLEALQGLEAWADDPEFQERWRDVKLANKRRLSAIINDRTGIAVDPESLFDLQVQRLHEYKRQHLNVLHILTSTGASRQIRMQTLFPAPSFSGQGAPGYYAAKLIIKLVNSVAELVNAARSARQAQGRILPELQCLRRAMDLSGCGLVGTDLDCRHGGKWPAT
jgi:starch phosphorylase